MARVRVESAAPEKTLVTYENAETIYTIETVSLFTHAQHLLQPSQEVPTTPTTANTLLMLTTIQKQLLELSLRIHSLQHHTLRSYP